jgi:hypothetical protein
MPATNFGDWASDQPIKNGSVQIVRGERDAAVGWPSPGFTFNRNLAGDVMGIAAPSVPYSRMWKVEGSGIIQPGAPNGWRSYDIRLQLHTADSSSYASDSRGITTHQVRIAMDIASYTNFQSWHVTGEYWLLANTGYTCYMQAAGGSSGSASFYQGGDYMNLLGIISGEGFV